VSVTFDSNAGRTNPTLSDYARSIWRRKVIVAVGLIAGIALGVVVFPRVLPSNPAFAATTRLDVRPLVLQGQNASGNDNAAGAAPAGAGGLPPDTLAAQTVIDDLGSRARHLTVLRTVDRSRWPTKLAGAIRSSAIAGTTQVQVSFADDDAALAGTTLESYVSAYADRRNSIYAQQVSQIRASLNREAEGLAADVQRWSSLADRERRSGGGVSVATSTQLDLAKQRYAETASQIDDLNRTAALNPTQILDRISVAPSDNAGNSGIALALGLLLGIMGGIGFAFLAEAVGPKIVTPADVQASTGLTVLATVPKLPRRRLRGSGVVVVDRPFSPSAEGYRRVGTALERQGLGTDIRVLAVVSADPGDGKSLLAANLAHSLARQGREVVLVSGDLRRPQVEKLLGIEQRAGLAEALRDDPIPVIAMVMSIKECLMLLPAGMPTKHPGELLASRRLAEIIGQLREVGNVVILDTPPTRLSADAIALAGVADATVLVAKSGSTRMRSFLEAVSGLRRDQIRQLGVALVATSSPLLRSRRYHYYREEQRDLEVQEPEIQSWQLHRSSRSAPRSSDDWDELPPVDAEITDFNTAAERNRRAME
jgi:capsular exopolysaccharide synthesis family protein